MYSFFYLHNVAFVKRPSSVMASSLFLIEVHFTQSFGYLSPHVPVFPVQMVGRNGTAATQLPDLLLNTTN